MSQEKVRVDAVFFGVSGLWVGLGPLFLGGETSCRTMINKSQGIIFVKTCYRRDSRVLGLTHKRNNKRTVGKTHSGAIVEHLPDREKSHKSSEAKEGGSSKKKRESEERSGTWRGGARHHIEIRLGGAGPSKVQPSVTITA